MIKLSATVITFNEENNIARCLDALKSVADEIIVVDSYSTDKTEEICESYRVKFIKNKFEGHIEQKNFALEQTCHQTVLSVDADEVLSPELQQSIINMKKNIEFDGYVFNRLNNYCGKWIYHCGWYPDKKLRIIKKGHGKWIGENPHDYLQLNDSRQKQGFLIGDLHHYSYNTISEHVAQANKFTSISSKAAFEKGVRVGRYKGFYRGILQFFRDYLLKGGILDGHYGLVICILNGHSTFLKFEKIYEYQINEKKHKLI
jgi:glycosyltransferase involved in cell wall biosynthesis